jgi:hypothetical protein
VLADEDVALVGFAPSIVGNPDRLAGPAGR